MTTKTKKLKLEMVTQGELPEVGEAIRKMLVDCLGVDDAHVVTRHRPDTSSGGWVHVYAPASKVLMAHALIAAYRQGRCDAMGQGHASDLRFIPSNRYV